MIKFFGNEVKIINGNASKNIDGKDVKNNGNANKKTTDGNNDGNTPPFVIIAWKAKAETFLRLIFNEIKSFGEMQRRGTRLESKKLV